VSQRTTGPADPSSASPLDALTASQRSVEAARTSARNRIPSASETEQLRQEKETFDQAKSDTQSWSKLRLSMGWTALVLLPTLAAAAIFILIEHDHFSTVATTSAAATVLLQTVTLVVAVWRLVLGSGPAPLAPVTKPADTFPAP
jgi:hypothetical protein